MNYEDLAQFDTQLTADVVAWRPTGTDPAPLVHQLVCGTYYLHKETKRREGRLYLLDFESETRRLQVINSKDFLNSGILDMTWLNCQRLLTIDSNNDLELIDFVS